MRTGGMGPVQWLFAAPGAVWLGEEAQRGADSTLIFMGVPRTLLSALSFPWS